MTDEVIETGWSSTKIIAASVGVVVVAFIALLATRDVQRNEPSTEIVGQGVPAVAGTSYDGQTFDIDEVLAANRAPGVALVDQEWVVINFFASWCIPCREEHPDLIRFDTEGAPCASRLVGVTFNDSADNVREFFDDLGGDWPVLVDADSIAIDFSVLTAPETVVVAPSGLVTAKFIGRVTYDQLVETIEC